MRKAGPPRDIPPPLEIECLKALWALGEANVKDVREHLAGRRSLAYTTVMTVLDRLEGRGRVTRRKVGRFYVYSPVLQQDALRRLAVHELVQSLFNGSEETLRAYLGVGEARVEEDSQSSVTPASP